MNKEIAKIYQIKDISKCKYAFMNYDYAKNNNFNFNNYQETANITITDKITNKNINTILEMIFAYGNIKQDFFKNNKKARSISESDIIELKGHKYYVNDIGFVEL